MKNRKTIKNAFTLVEVILYMSLTSILVLMVAMLWVTASDTRDRSEAMSIVNTEGTHIISQLTQIIRNANSITTPTATNSGNSLTIAVPTSVLSPTTIALSGGNLSLTEGSNSPITLNSNRVSISSLTFRNVSKDYSVGSVRVEITISYINNTGKTSLNYSQTFYATATLR